MAKSLAPDGILVNTVSVGVRFVGPGIVDVLPSTQVVKLSSIRP